MTSDALDPGALTAFVQRRIGGLARDLEMDVRLLRGGLESPAVARVGARFIDPRGRSRLLSFVVKRLEGGPAREADIYETVVAATARGFSPALLGVERTGQDGCLLFLEPVRAPQRWPWRETEWAARVLECLAELHGAPPHAARTSMLASWDYEAELLGTARRAVEMLEELPEERSLSPIRRGLPVLRRVAAALPAMRRHLLGLPGLGPTVLHGDVHPGNVLLRVRGGRPEPVLLDWGRARTGSPLEDVSSWLQSLGYWEPQARRRHDTLLVRYLAARGLPPRLDRGLRDAYWIAGASNVLAGALSYHVWRVTEARADAERSRALDAAGDALRIIRRADACWRAAAGRESPPEPPGGSGR